MFIQFEDVLVSPHVDGDNEGLGISDYEVEGSSGGFLECFRDLLKVLIM